MFPLRDEIRSQTTPWVNYAIIAACAAIFLFELSLEGALDDFVAAWGLVPWNMTRGIAAHGFSFREHVAPWFSSMFLHGGWVHLLGNMWFLHIFGDNVEDRLGRTRFLVLYLCGGLVAGLAQVISAPGESVPMVGASGAISAVVAAYAVLYPKARVLTVIPIFIFLQFVRLPAYLFIGVWFLIQFASGYASLLSHSSGGVAWWAHVGGFLAGAVLAMVLKAGTVPRESRPVLYRRYHLVRNRWD